MMLTLAVTVTCEDAMGGVRHSCYECPVALAITRALSERMNTRTLQVAVYYACCDSRARIDYGTSTSFYYLPIAVTEKIRTFDKTGKMDPFSFNMEIDL